MSRFSVYRYHGWNLYSQSEHSQACDASSIEEAAASILTEYEKPWIVFAYSYASDTTFYWGNGQEQMGRIVVIDKDYKGEIHPDLKPLRAIIEEGLLSFAWIMSLPSAKQILKDNWAEFYARFGFERHIVELWELRRFLPDEQKRDEILGFLNTHIPMRKDA